MCGPCSTHTPSIFLFGSSGEHCCMEDGWGVLIKSARCVDHVPLIRFVFFCWGGRGSIVEWGTAGGDPVLDEPIPGIVLPPGERSWCDSVEPDAIGLSAVQP